MTEKQENLIHSLESAYKELIYAVNSVRPGDLDVRISGGWSTRDILGHIVSWGDEYRREIRAIRVDTTPSYGYVISKEYKYHDWNQDEVTAKADWPWRRIRADVDRDRAEMINLVEDLTDSDLEIMGTVPWKMESVKLRPMALTRDNACTIGELLALHIRHIRDHADIVLKNRKGPVQLFFDVVRQNKMDQVRKFLEQHPDFVSIQDENGAEAIHYAVLLHHHELTHILIRAGADINARDGKSGATPTDWAVEDLRKKGALLSAEIEDTLLAIKSQDIAAAHRLINRCPALKDVCDRQGKPLADYAGETRNPALVSLFQQEEPPEEEEQPSS